MSDARYSPMLEQYFSMKARYPDAILLSRVGDFYEAYGEDATTIAAALQIALTSKEAGGGGRVAMAGVPHHALDKYLAELVAQQRIVALADQLEIPVPNKLVRRDVTRVVTPGTLIEEHLLDRGSNNYLAALTLAGDAIGIAYADISTGRAAATAYSGEAASRRRSRSSCAWDRPRSWPTFRPRFATRSRRSFRPCASRRRRSRSWSATNRP